MDIYRIRFEQFYLSLASIFDVSCQPSSPRLLAEEKSELRLAVESPYERKEEEGQQPSAVELLWVAPVEAQSSSLG